MRNLMLDIETMGTGPDAVILSIGYCTFDESNIYEPRSLYPRLDEQGNRVADIGTVQWWMQQDRQAISNTFGPHQVAHTTRSRSFIAEELDEQFKEAHTLWANGVDFDYGIIGDYLRGLIRIPYWKQRDARTIFKTFGGLCAPVENPVKHSALDDAITQAQYLQRIAKALNKRAPKGKRLLEL